MTTIMYPDPVGLASPPPTVPPILPPTPPPTPPPPPIRASGSGGAGQASEMGSFPSGLPSEDLYLERRHGRRRPPRSGNPHPSEPSASELRQREAADNEEGRVRDGRTRQWVVGEPTPESSRAGTDRTQTQPAAASASTVVVEPRSRRSGRRERHGAETSREEEPWVNARARTENEIRRIQEERRCRANFELRQRDAELDNARRFLGNGGDPEKLAPHLRKHFRV